MLSIIIVNYKTPLLTKACISSVMQSSVTNFEIIVVDNASNDNSKEIICSEFSNIIWIQNQENEGFGRANNKGIEIAKGEFILLLNSDVTVKDDTIIKCLEHVKSDNNIGVLGCKLLYPNNSTQKSYYYYIADYNGVLKYNLFLDYIYKFTQPKKIKAVMGAFMMFPSKIFEEVGKFDPDFFMYAEEIHLCYRISKKNYKIVYFEETFAIHHHGASSNSVWSVKQNYLSEALLFYKVKGFMGYCLYHLIFLFNTLTNSILMWKLNNAYRRSFIEMTMAYYSNFFHYLVIPFKFSRKIGNGKRLLRAS